MIILKLITKQSNHKKNDRIITLCNLIIILIPMFSTIILVNFYLNKSIFNFVPRWSDEIFYWHQIATFKVAQFNGGYYTFNEIPPPLSYMHFYAHGPVYSFLLGTIAMITGWYINSAPFFNLSFLTFSIIFFVIYNKLNYQQILFTGLLILTFWPIHLYMVSNMRVTFFISLGIIVASFFYKMLLKINQLSVMSIIIFFIIILLLSFLQITNVILLFSYFLLIRHKIGLSYKKSIFLSVILIIFIYTINNQLIAPYPNFLSNFLKVLPSSFFDGILLFIKHLGGNFYRLFVPNQTHFILWFVLRLQLIFILAYSCLLLHKNITNQLILQESLFSIINSGLTFVGVLLFYDIGDWRDYRVFAPVVLMSALLFVLRQRIFVVSVLLALNLVCLPWFLPTYNQFMSDAFTLKQKIVSIEEFRAQISSIIKYKEDKNPWCNTLLTSSPFHSYMFAIPPGIGISCFESSFNFKSIKSRYILLDKNSYENLKQKAALDFKGTTNIGNLYVNKTNLCK